MTFREKMLYHQIHPAKLATDIGAYDATGNVIETHEHKGNFKEW